jgi:hypothetical protein
MKSKYDIEAIAQQIIDRDGMTPIQIVESTGIPGATWRNCYSILCGLETAGHMVYHDGELIRILSKPVKQRLTRLKSERLIGHNLIEGCDWNGIGGMGVLG